MKEIPGWVYLLVGAAVSFVSYYVNYVQGSMRMTLFLAFGIVLLIVGFIKIIFGNFKKTEKYVHPVTWKAKTGFRISQVPGIKYCNKCGQMARINYLSCEKCGSK